MRTRDHRVLVEHSVGLLKLACRKPQPYRRPIGALHVFEGVTQHDRQLIHMGGLEACQTVGGHADQRRVDRLMLTAFRRQRQSGRRGHQQEAGILVAAIQQRIEAAVDERVIYRADR